MENEQRFEGHIWSTTKVPLTVDSALELFQEAVDLQPPDSHGIHS